MKEVSVNDLKKVGEIFIVKDTLTGKEARLKVHRIHANLLQAKRLSDDAYFDFSLINPMEETKFYIT